MHENTPSITHRADKSTRASEKHYRIILDLWKEIDGTSNTNGSKYLELFHQILHELSADSNGHSGPSPDQKIDYDYLAELAELLIECSFGNTDKGRLQAFLQHRWMKHVLAENRTLEPVTFISGDKASILRTPRGPDRRSTAGCRRACQRPTLPVDRRIADRRTRAAELPA